MPCITLFGGPMHLETIDIPKEQDVWTCQAAQRMPCGPGLMLASETYHRHSYFRAGRRMDIMVADTANSADADDWAFDQIVRELQDK